MARSVVVTGASSGIGRAVVLRLAAEGWQVWAGVRSESDGQQLVEDGGARVVPLLLDVTDERSIAAAAAAVTKEVAADGVSGLVNNAGVPVGGPIEYLPLSEWRRALEVNVLGQVAVTQTFLPLVRIARGRIVFVGSITGRISTPLNAPYQASKHAVEAIAGSLRQELAPDRVDVVLIEPGVVHTRIWDHASQVVDDVESALPPEGRRRYGAFITANRRRIEQARTGGIPAERVATVIGSALTSSRPRARYLVGPDAYLLGTLTRVLPDRLLDQLVARLMGVSPHPSEDRGPTQPRASRTTSSTRH